MPYTDPGQIEQYLGVVLSTEQVEAATARAAAVTLAIDAYTGRSWQGTTGISETHVVTLDRLWLSQTPVVAIASVTRREGRIGATSTALVAGTGYELVNAARGELLVEACPGQRVTVTYSAAAEDADRAIPADVALAATQWAAALLGPTLQPDSEGGTIRSVSEAGGDFTVTYATPPSLADGPPSGVAALLAPYRQPVFAQMSRAATLERHRTRAAGRLPDRCDIRRPSGGGASAALTTVATDVPCRITPLGQDDLATTPGGFDPLRGRLAWLAWDADVLAGDELTAASGRRYRVAGTNADRSESVYLKAYLEIKG